MGLRRSICAVMVWMMTVMGMWMRVCVWGVGMVSGKVRSSVMGSRGVMMNASELLRLLAPALLLQVVVLISGG
jgi:hypothetical protein